MRHREEASRPWLAAALLVGATFAVYANAFGNAFVWDDLPLIVDNPRIKSWRMLPALLTSNLFAGGVSSSYYRPLQGLSYLSTPTSAACFSGWASSTRPKPSTGPRCG